MTAVQQVFSDLLALHPRLFNINSVEGREFVHHFHKHLLSAVSPLPNTYESLEHRHGENYYNEIYKSE